MKEKNIPKANAKQDIEQLRKWFEEEIKKRDKIIDDLREQNKLLMKNSFNLANKYQEFVEKTEKKKE